MSKGTAAAEMSPLLSGSWNIRKIRTAALLRRKGAGYYLAQWTKPAKTIGLGIKCRINGRNTPLTAKNRNSR